MSFFYLLAVVLLIPIDAYAWGPVTHLEYASQALGGLALFAPAVKKLIGRYKDHFLYGAVAADITLGKNLRGYFYNCHNWGVALDLFYHKAKKDSQKAFMLGYLSHLAADTVAHNFFVPYTTLLSWENRMTKHVYWEIRMDLTVPKKYWDLMSSFSKNPFEEDDLLLEQYLKRTFLSFRTNKIIFNKLLNLQQMKHYQKVITRVAHQSPLGLVEGDIRCFKQLAQNAVIDFLRKVEGSYVMLADPTGRLKIQHSKQAVKDLKNAKKMGILTPESEKQFISETKSSLKIAIYQPSALPEVGNYLVARK